MDNQTMSQLVKFKMKVINDHLPNQSGHNTNFKYLNPIPVQAREFITPKNGSPSQLSPK